MAKDIKSFTSEWDELQCKFTNIETTIDSLDTALKSLIIASNKVLSINSRGYEPIGSLNPTFSQADIAKLRDGREKLRDFCANIHDELIEVIDLPFAKNMAIFSEAVFAINPEDISITKTGDAVGEDSKLFMFVNDILKESALKNDFSKWLKDLGLYKEKPIPLNEAIENAFSLEKNRVLKQIELLLGASKHSMYGSERINDISKYLSILLFQLEPYMHLLTSEDIKKLKNLDDWAKLSDAHKAAAEGFVREFEEMLLASIVKADTDRIGKFVGYLTYGADGINSDGGGFFKLYDNPTLLSKGEQYFFSDLYDKYEVAPYAALQSFGGSEGPNETGNIKYGGQAANYNPQKGTLVYNEIERYAIALGPYLQNPNFNPLYFGANDMAYGTCVDIAIQIDNSRYYIPAIIVDTKGHSSPTGIFQTGIPFGDGNKENTGKSGSIVEWYTPQITSDGNKSTGLNQFNKNGSIIIYREEVLE